MDSIAKIMVISLDTEKAFIIDKQLHQSVRIKSAAFLLAKEKHTEKETGENLIHNSLKT